MHSWPAAILFDFDGVIVHSEPLHFEAFRAVAAEEKIDLTEEEYYRDLIGFDDRGAFRHLFAKHERPLDPKTMLRILTRKTEAVRTMIEDRKYSALPGVEEFVRGLWRSYPLAICSGALREEIEAMLEGVNLRDCFTVIVAAEDVTIGKPDPQGYLLAAKQLGAQHGKSFEPADCLIIEDAPTVVSSVRQVGFPVLAVATSYPAAKLAEANYVVSSLLPDEVRRVCPKLKFIE
jgi:beta-phosphoglucomutase